MTRTPLPNRFLPRLAVVAAASALSVLGLALASANSADASARTKSAVIADAATEAVDALEQWQQTSHPLDYVRFVRHRDHTAALTEIEIEIGTDALRDAWAGVSVAKQHAVLSAVTQLGVPYRYLASKPGVGFDCSGLTIWAFESAGIEIPRVSRSQINAATATERDDAEAGDLVYYPGHISMYIGASSVIHSPETGSHVEIVGRLPDKSSLRFGDAEAAQLSSVPESDSLMDRALAIAQ